MCVCGVVCGCTKLSSCGGCMLCGWAACLCTLHDHDDDDDDDVDDQTTWAAGLAVFNDAIIIFRVFVVRHFEHIVSFIEMCLCMCCAARRRRCRPVLKALLNTFIYSYALTEYLCYSSLFCCRHQLSYINSKRKMIKYFLCSFFIYSFGYQLICLYSQLTVRLLVRCCQF